MQRHKAENRLVFLRDDFLEVCGSQRTATLQTYDPTEYVYTVVKMHSTLNIYVSVECI